jgi:general secretion pathway protein E
MVGEIRDVETAEIAIQASLTGHLVLSTIHTNDAATGITRLVDMGVQPFLVASSLVALQAQRLVRRVCTHCCRALPSHRRRDRGHRHRRRRLLLRRPAAQGPDARRARRGHPLSAIGGRKLPPAGHIYRAAGCEKCHGSGYSGRTGSTRCSPITEEIRRLAIRNADSGQIKAAALAQGMRTLRDDGALKVVAGITTLDEVMPA